MKAIRLTVWAITVAATVFLFVADELGCSTARMVEPCSEPVARLIQSLGHEDKQGASYALWRLRVVTEKDFQTKEEWQTWYKNKTQEIVKQLTEGHENFQALGECWRLFQLLGDEESDVAAEARKKLEAKTGKKFEKNEEWQAWLSQMQQAQSMQAIAIWQAISEAGKYRIKEAVPILQRCLEKYVKATTIYGLPAAQALYLIGTPEAHEVLKKYLSMEEYDIEQSIGYMYSWSVMPWDAIDSFIRDYHLASTSDRLKVKIECSDKYHFKGSVTNVSEDEILTYGQFILLFCSPDGYFLRRKVTSFIHVDPVYPRPRKPLKPGETKTSNMQCKVRKPARLVRYFRDFESNRILEEQDGCLGHILGKQGEYEVYAIYSFPKRENVYYPWPKDTVFGRWVSEPIKVKIEW